MEKLLVSAKGEEVRYLVRTLGQNLRVGAVRTSILTALGRAVALSPLAGIAVLLDSSLYASLELQAEGKAAFGKSKRKGGDTVKGELNNRFSRAEAIIKRAYVQHPNYDHIAAALLEVGLDGLADRLPLTVGGLSPLAPSP